MRYKQIITISDLRNPAVLGVKKEPVKEVDSNKYAYLKTIRTNPKVVEIYDRKTMQTNVYSSTYKLHRALNISPSYIRNGKIWKTDMKLRLDRCLMNLTSAFDS